MVYTTPDGISLSTSQTMQTRSVVEGRVRVIVTGHKTQNVYYIKDLGGNDSRLGHQCRYAGDRARSPNSPRAVGIATVNADETLLAGTYIEGDGRRTTTARSVRAAPATRRRSSLDQPRNKGQMMEERLAAHLPMALFTIDTSRPAK